LALGVLKTTTFILLAVLAVVSGANAAPPVGGEPFSRAELRRILQDVSAEHGVDPALMEALVSVESAFNPYAVSRKGAMGLMQLMPATARRLQVDDPFDPEQNIRGGVQEFSRLVRRYAGNLSLALAAYNAGEGAVRQYRGIPPYRETRRYVARIMELYTGRPYRIGGLTRKAPQVRLIRNPGSGKVVITNATGGLTLETNRAAEAEAALGGGFGR